MAWNLQLVPNGLLLSKYIKNNLLSNPNSIQNISANQLLSDNFQVYNSNNNANISFQLGIFNDDPKNQQAAPSITSITDIIISNDPNFQQILVITPAPFSSAYNSYTNYSVDLSTYNISNSSLPANQSVVFTTSSGSGIVSLNNWTLSGSSGIKRVFLQVVVTLSDGTTATYPSNLQLYDEIVVLSNYASAPTKPKIIGASSTNYATTPLYFNSSVASNSGVVGSEDAGVGAYFWDGLILNSNINIVRNNYSQTKSQIFYSASPSNLNTEKFPVVYTGVVSTGLASTGAYSSYITGTPYSISSSNNIYFHEVFMANITDQLNYTSTANIFYEFNLLQQNNNASNNKYLRQQLVFNLQQSVLTIVTSIDDSTWSSDTNYIPSAVYKTTTITNPNVIGSVLQSGVFLSLTECIDFNLNIYQTKLIFKPNSAVDYVLLNEIIFTSNTLVPGGNIYGEVRTFIRNATSTIALESNQYGVCQGTISAAVTPNEKIFTNENLPIQSNLNSLYGSEYLNTWFAINNSPSAGSVAVSGNTVKLFNNEINTSTNDLSSVELQSSVPTFSENCTQTLNFSFSTSATISNYNSSVSFLKCAYSFDSNLNFTNFVYNDLLKTTTGLSLPQAIGQYDLISNLNWAGSNFYGLNIYDVGSAQTCSITTTVTTNLFYFSQSNSSGSLIPPTVIRSQYSLSTSNTYNAWISTNGYSTSNIYNQSIIVKNQGVIPISINTGLGLNTILPGQPYVLNSISTQATQPTSLIINTYNTVIASSVNFIYDFTQTCNVSSVSIAVQITTPPDCPNLPSVQFSLESSSDFLVWTSLTSLSPSSSFNPNTGKMTLTFDTGSSVVKCRYIRLRIYKNASATFDPTKNWVYSAMSATATAVNSLAMNGKLVFGFTDTSAKNLSLGALYNQPTYLRKFSSNTSKYIGFVIDFTDYQYSSNLSGPVYLSLLTDTGEYKIQTLSNLVPSLVYSATLSVQRQNSDDAFKLVPSISISGGGLSSLNFTLDEILYEPSDTAAIGFGYYPFVSLVGSGEIDVTTNIITGTYNQALDYPNNETYFTLLSAENSDYTANYGKNLLAQNTYNGVSTAFPQINTYFSANVIQNYDYNNVTYTVFAASTSNLGLYGLTYIDGVYLATCDLVLVAGQTDRTQNGIYQVQNQQWVKLSIFSGSFAENTVLVTNGNIFNDTLWMQDNITGDWIPNIIICPLILNDNNLLFTGISSIYKYPQYVKLAVNANGISTINNQNQVKIKLANSPNVYLSQTDNATQWIGLLQNGQFNSLNIKDASNNTAFMNFGISSSQILGITSAFLPAIYNLIVSFSGNYQPYVTNNSYFSLPTYGQDYRAFINDNLIYQMYSNYENISISQTTNSIVNTSVYGLNLAGVKTLQSGFSTDIIIDNVAPAVGILSVITDNTKSVLLGLTTVTDSGAGLALARIVQKNPANQYIYGSWIGFNSNSYYGVSQLTAYPTYVIDSLGVTTGEPLSGYYRYYLEIADYAGNISQTNQVESLYYESALLDTQGPQGTVAFTNNSFSTPISITSSTILSAQLFAKDIYSGVKSFRYKILPDGDFTDWLNFSQNVNITVPQSVEDGSLSIQFQFKDFANNVLYSNSTNGTDYYVYTWNIVSKFLNNIVFTVVETTTYNNNAALLIGAAYNGSAALFLWDGTTLLQLQFPNFGAAKVISAMLAVSNQVIIGTDIGQTFVYQNGSLSGPYAQFKVGSQALPVSKFTVHQYASEAQQYVYASTLNIPRIFRTPISNLKNLSWQNVQTPPIYITGINVLNTGLWSGNSIYYSISSSYIAPSLTPVLSYGISSVIVSNSGQNYTTTPKLVLNGPITGAGLSPVMQGKIDHFNLFNGGIAYTSGATVSIDPPALGGSSIQATGVAYTDATGVITAVILTNPGYGYTSTPNVRLIGVSGGSQATATASIVYDSIYSVNVTAAGIATTTAITISVLGNGQNASLIPSFNYTIPQIAITNPGFGFTSNPTISVNGITTLATSTIANGSLSSVNVVGNNYVFPLSQTASVSAIGGFSTGWSGSFSTSSISFSTGTTISYTGTVLNSINVNSSASGIATLPSISFSSSIYSPEIRYVTSDDLILAQSSGSIYDIKSFDQNLFFTSSTGDIIELTNINNVFHTVRNRLYGKTNLFETLTPQELAVYTDGISTSLMFSIIEEPFIGTLQKTNNSKTFNAFSNNIISYKPYNFDILSDWQLVKNLNTSGSANVNYSNNSILFSANNAQIFYQSTKNSTWFNRCTANGSYLITFIFALPSNGGILSAEISTFSSTLKVTFDATSTENTLVISFGSLTCSSISIPSEDLYTISFISTGTSVSIYSDYILVYSNTSFSTLTTTTPIIKFGVIYKPNVITINNASQNIFQNNFYGTNIYLEQIKFSFNTADFSSATSTYTLNLPYVMPNAAPVRVLKSLNGSIYAATKSITDLRSTSTYSDIGSKVFNYNNNQWNDVTGSFEIYSQGVSTSLIISSPNDIGVLNNSFFITGLTKSISTKNISATEIILGLSSSNVYEESNLIVSVIYPYNPGAAGAYVYLSNNNGLINLPASVYFSPTDLIKTISVGVGSTSSVVTSSITATDGTSFATSTVSILPIQLSAISLNTSSFVGYSQANIISTVTLQSTPKTDRTFSLLSNNSSSLSTPNNGIATVRSGSASTSITLSVGVATTTSSVVNITASYRSSIQTASITVNPFILSLGLSTNQFFGNQLYGGVSATATVQTAPKSNLFVSVNPGLTTVLGVASGFILAGTISTTLPLAIGAAVTANLSIPVTGIVTGGVSTATITAKPFVIAISTASNYYPILGLQTSYITFTLNTTPTNNVIIYNVIQNPVGVSLVYPSSTSIIGGSISTVFGISTTKQTSAGLIGTIQGAPLGYNTSPTPGLMITSDIWRITNLIVSPNTVVGGAAYANGIAQSYIITATLNYSAVGLATTILLSSNTSYVNFGTSLMNFYGTATSVGYATGISTSYATGVAITATGPNGVTSTVSGLIINPLLISSVSTSYVWVNYAKPYNYTVGGVGASAYVTATLNAYVYGTAQTVSFSGLDSHITTSLGAGFFLPPPAPPALGIGTILPGQISTSIVLGFNSTPVAISTNITATLVSSATGIGTTTVNIQPFPGYNIVFNPFFGIQTSSYYVYVNSPIPNPVGYAITFNNTQTAYNTVQNLGIQTIQYNYIGQDTTLIAQSTIIGILQTYYITGYAQSGGAYGMGYNNNGVLTANYPLGGAATKLYLGISSIAKVSSGYDHIIALDTSGNAWTIGDNSYGQLGYLTTPQTYSNMFRKVPSPNGLMVRDVHAQNNTTYIITADNSMFAFGNNVAGQFGTSAYYLTSTYIPQLVSTSVLLLSVHQDNGVIVNYNNFTGIQTVYEFGTYQSSVGLIGKSINQVSSAGITRNISNLNITNINRGYNHTVASGIWSDVALGIASSGLFAWGYNTFGQLGLNVAVASTTVPNVLYKYTSTTTTPIEYTNLIIADGDAYSGFSLAVGAANTIYFIGRQNSSNSAGVGIGYNTTIAQYPAFGFSTNSPIYRITKSAQHYMWTLGIGSVIVSGGIKTPNYSFTQVYPSLAQYTPHTLFAQNGNSTYYLDQSTYWNFVLAYYSYNGTAYAYTPQLFTNFSSGYNFKQIIKFTPAFIVAPNEIITAYLSGATPTLNTWTATGIVNADYISVDSNATWAYRGGFKGYIYTTYNPGRINLIDVTQGGLGNLLSVPYTGTNVFPVTFIISQNLSYYSWQSSTNGVNVQNYLDFVMCAGYYIHYFNVTLSNNVPTNSVDVVSYIPLDSQIAAINCFYYSTSGISQGNGPSFYSSLIVTAVSGTVYRFEGTNASNTALTNPFVIFTSVSIRSVTPSQGYVNFLSNSGINSVFFATTSDNYLVALDSALLTVYGYIKVPISGSNTIVSVTWQSSSLSVSGIVAVTDSAGNNFVFQIPSNANYEMGLNYFNSAGSYQLLTYDGSQAGLGMTSIVYAKTSDTFSVVIDSSKPFG